MKAHRAYFKDKIQAHLKLPEELSLLQSLSVPYTALIGMEAMSYDFEFKIRIHVIISLKLTHVFRSKLTHPLTDGSVG